MNEHLYAWKFVLPNSRCSLSTLLQYILVSDEIIASTERVRSAENSLQLFLLIEIVFNISISIFFRDMLINQM